MTLGAPDIIKAEMLKDVTDISAASVVALYPTRFDSPADVPEYLYKSLQTIWGSSLDMSIITDLGGGQTRAEGNIIISETAIFESNEVRDSMIDLPGAESAQIDITFQKPRNQLGPQIVKNAELRTRLIIDYTLRQNIKFIQPDLPMSVGAIPNLTRYDLSIDDAYWFKCFWRGYAIEAATSHVVARYRTEYVRMFLSV